MRLLTGRISQWADVSRLGEQVCIYTTGSFGRGDASTHSDLDVFVVSLEEELTRSRLLTNLQEIELLASIVHVNRELELPDLDADGNFLKAHALSEYLVGLGKPSDDANNTFTGRLLLLLESKVIFGEVAYQRVRRECIERYWTDFADHSDAFLPAFLVNDILRFWRTLCINYEAGGSTDPARRRAKNFKLKFSRLLTCYSAVLALLLEYQERSTVTPDAALAILALSPTDRLDNARRILGRDLSGLIDELYTLYDWFLSETDCSKSDLYRKMEDPEYYRESLGQGRNFGDAMFRLFREVALAKGEDSAGWRFFRYVTI